MPSFTAASGPGATAHLRLPGLLTLRLRLHHDGAGLRPHRLLPHGDDPEHGRHGLPRTHRSRHRQ